MDQPIPVNFSSNFCCNGATVSITLEGLKATDFYATNVKNTGCTGNWFGSGNIINMLLNDAERLFGADCNLLELGSGLGEAGILCYKILLQLQSTGSVLLTDGEPEVLELLEKNCKANSSFEDDACKLHCSHLSWGNEHQIADIKKSTDTSSFDIIIGSDLIYGHNSAEHLSLLLSTVNALLCRDIESRPLGVFESKRYPVFFLALARRAGISIEDIRIEAKKHQLNMTMLEDYTFDIFENNVEVESFLWADTILEFSREPLER